jgi:hypothetical protein
MIKMETGKKFGFALTLVLAVVLLPGERAIGADLQALINTVVAQNKTAAESQDRIEKLDGQTDRLLVQYREVERNIESLRMYSEQVEKLVMAQREKLEKMRLQIDQAAQMGREITPLMIRMLDNLAQFVELDVPFLKEERAKRIGDLRDMMENSDITDSEKYRRVLEAYQVETDYARNLDTYKAKMQLEGKEATVEFLRVGRIALVYRTIDGSKAGVWDQENRKWKALDSDYFDAIHRAFRIGMNLTAPDLMLLPIPAAKVAQ